METIRTTCGICLDSCGVLVHLENGKPVRVEGDPESPMSQGALCAKGLASLELLNHPDRLRHPLRRKGERGEGKWEQISWDEALDTVAGELRKAKDRYGAESVHFVRGGHKGLQVDYMTRFSNAFGTPNISSMASVCFNPHVYGAKLTSGFFPGPDYEYPPACTIVWGLNMLETGRARYQKTLQALNRGTRLIVVDPNEIQLVNIAELWLKPRPGSDLALALGMINVIINEGLYDREFVDRWTVGFDELKTHVQSYSPEKVQDITWVDADQIRKAARLFATTRPGCIQWGNGIEHNVNGFQVARAMSILRAITGNLCVPGGELDSSPLPILEPSSAEFSLRDMIPPEKRANRISSRDNLMPIVYYALPQRLIRSILEGDPYPIRVVYVMGSNPLLSYSNTQETYKALKKLDFLVVSELFMTPTAAMADIVLPAASYLEVNSVKTLQSAFGLSVALVQQKIAEVKECRSEYQMLSRLAKKLGLGEYFWDSEEECLDYILKPAGLSFKEFKQVGVISSPKQYRNYERSGFQTPSGKVELYSNQLNEWGFDPLPVFRELPETPYSSPELAKEYPLIFTSSKPEPYRHSEGKQIASLRQMHPEPTTTIHPQTADSLGITEGDLVYIETKRGRIKQKAHLSDRIDPRIAIVDYGWWFPERGISSLFGYSESNINMLTDNKEPIGPEVGAANLRGIMCKVYKTS